MPQQYQLCDQSIVERFHPTLQFQNLARHTCYRERYKVEKQSLPRHLLPENHSIQIVSVELYEGKNITMDLFDFNKHGDKEIIDKIIFEAVVSV